MTKTEARKIATAMRAWWMQTVDVRTTWPPSTKAEYLAAIDLLTQPSTIAENIRDVAINWPQFLGDIECGILEAFINNASLKCSLMAACHSPRCSKSLQYQARTFMLFVVEALDS